MTIRGDGTLVLIDPRAHDVETITAGIPSTVGRCVASSPDGLYAYLPLYGSGKPHRTGMNGRYMLVVNMANRKVCDFFDFGKGVRPHSVSFDRFRNRLYVTTEEDRSLTVIDANTLELINRIPTGHAPHLLILSEDGCTGYTSSTNTGTVSVIDMRAQVFLKEIAVSSRPVRISVSRDHRHLFATDGHQASVSVIALADTDRRSAIPLPAAGHGMATTLHHNRLLVAMRSRGELAAIDLNSMKVVSTLKVGHDPEEVFVCPDGHTAYVSCPRAAVIAVVNLRRWIVEAHVPVGRNAYGMAWAS